MQNKNFGFTQDYTELQQAQQDEKIDNVEQFSQIVNQDYNLFSKLFVSILNFKNDLEKEKGIVFVKTLIGYYNKHMTEIKGDEKEFVENLTKISSVDLSKIDGTFTSLTQDMKAMLSFIKQINEISSKHQANEAIQKTKEVLKQAGYVDEFSSLDSYVNKIFNDKIKNMITKAVDCMGNVLEFAVDIYVNECLQRKHDYMKYWNLWDHCNKMFNTLESVFENYKINDLKNFNGRREEIRKNYIDEMQQELKRRYGEIYNKLVTTLHKILTTDFVLFFSFKMFSKDYFDEWKREDPVLAGIMADPYDEKNLNGVTGKKQKFMKKWIEKYENYKDRIQIYKQRLDEYHNCLLAMRRLAVAIKTSNSMQDIFKKNNKLLSELPQKVSNFNDVVRVAEEEIRDSIVAEIELTKEYDNIIYDMLNDDELQDPKYSDLRNDLKKMFTKVLNYKGQRLNERSQDYLNYISSNPWRNHNLQNLVDNYINDELEALQDSWEKQQKEEKKDDVVGEEQEENVENKEQPKEQSNDEENVENKENKEQLKEVYVDQPDKVYVENKENIENEEQSNDEENVENKENKEQPNEQSNEEDKKSESDVVKEGYKELNSEQLEKEEDRRRYVEEYRKDTYEPELYRRNRKEDIVATKDTLHIRGNIGKLAFYIHCVPIILNSIRDYSEGLEKHKEMLEKSPWWRNNSKLKERVNYFKLNRDVFIKQFKDQVNKIAELIKKIDEDIRTAYNNDDDKLTNLRKVLNSELTLIPSVNDNKYFYINNSPSIQPITFLSNLGEDLSKIQTNIDQFNEQFPEEGKIDHLTHKDCQESYEEDENFKQSETDMLVESIQQMLTIVQNQNDHEPSASNNMNINNSDYVNDLNDSKGDMLNLNL